MRKGRGDVDPHQSKRTTNYNHHHHHHQNIQTTEERSVACALSPAANDDIPEEVRHFGGD